MRAVPLQQLSPSPTPSILSSFNASRTPGAEEMETILKTLTDYELIVDSAEQAIERPLDYQTKKEYYSGKQKRI
jgi:hypothetical protein